MMQGTRPLLAIAYIVHSSCALMQLTQNTGYRFTDTAEPMKWSVEDCKATEVWGWPQDEKHPVPRPAASPVMFNAPPPPQESSEDVVVPEAPPVEVYDRLRCYAIGKAKATVLVVTTADANQPTEIFYADCAQVDALFYEVLGLPNHNKMLYSKAAIAAMAAIMPEGILNRAIFGNSRTFHVVSRNARGAVVGEPEALKKANKTAWGETSPLKSVDAVSGCLLKCHRLKNTVAVAGCFVTYKMWVRMSQPGRDAVAGELSACRPGQTTYPARDWLMWIAQVLSADQDQVYLGDTEFRVYRCWMFGLNPKLETPTPLATKGEVSQNRVGYNPAQWPNMKTYLRCACAAGSEVDLCGGEAAMLLFDHYCS